LGEHEALDAYLRRYGKVGLVGPDTRALTQHIRTHGTQHGALVADTMDDNAVRAALSSIDLSQSVYKVSTPKPFHVDGQVPISW